MQLSEMREYAGSRGWEIFEECTDEGISGSKESRPGLDRLMTDAHRRRQTNLLILLLRSPENKLRIAYCCQIGRTALPSDGEYPYSYCEGLKDSPTARRSVAASAQHACSPAPAMPSRDDFATTIRREVRSRIVS